jgi:hypothetical protein
VEPLIKDAVLDCALPETMETSQMKTTRIVLAALLIAGVAGAAPAATAKKHHKSHSMSMNKGSTSMKKPMPGDESSQGNVGPGTSNNNTKPGK